jgi:hypothetical protein
VNEPPPAEVLRRLKPIPTYRGHPATTPHDVAGLDPMGRPVEVKILRESRPVLLLFLSADCLGCLDLWHGLPALRAALSPDVGLAVVTRGAGEEDAAAVAALNPHDDPAGVASAVPTVMSSQAYADYQVGGPPFFVVVDAEQVRTEGVAWGVEETLRVAQSALRGP